MNYIDGFLLPIPKDRIEDYRAVAEKCSKIWLEHGALSYRECVGDDVRLGEVRSLLDAADAKENETIIFAWIEYRSRQHRDEVNAKVMQDPRMADFKPEDMPFDCRRIGAGGFKVIVAAG